jgi:two-component system, cell cycle sensor histidine kinase PleC
MFSYLRIISVLSLVVVAVVAAQAGIRLRDMAIDNMTKMVERDNISRATGYISSVWKQQHGVTSRLSGSDLAQLKNDPQVAQFAQDTIRYFQYMAVNRVNLYNAQGYLLLTVKVDDTRELTGASASPNMNLVFRQTKKPDVVSEVVPGVPIKNVALQTMSEATLVQTVFPISLNNNTTIEGSLELLYDVTEPWTELAKFQMYGTGGVMLLFFAFLSILYLASRQAENVIARQHEANLELSAAAEAAQAQNRDKSQFLANVSHELRTPLNAIIGFSDIIKNEVILALENKKYHDYINDIHASGVHLLSLINDILEYSKAEAGKLDLEVAEINATKLVQNSLRLVSPRAEQAKVKLVDAMPKEQFELMSDGKKFRQIMLNLLSNAVKFTPSGGEVRVTAWRDLTDDTCTFEVRDTGIGIAPKDISRAMAPFGQVDNTLSRKYEGTGLGLPLTKKFVEIMGGKFNIESQLNKGTTVTFTLPNDVRLSNAKAEANTNTKPEAAA